MNILQISIDLFFLAELLAQFIFPFFLSKLEKKREKPFKKFS